VGKAKICSKNFKKNIPSSGYNHASELGLRSGDLLRYCLLGLWLGFRLGLLLLLLLRLDVDRRKRI
jgi:hypothetical protein